MDVLALLRSLLAIGPNLRDPVQVAARTMWAEDRSGGQLGMQAVGCVIANRAKTPGWWGRDVISVCLAHEQFSSWNAGTPSRAALLKVTEADRSFAIAVGLARELVAGNLVDITRGADSYYASSIPKPAWAVGKPYCGTWGGQEFYQLGLRGLGEALGVLRPSLSQEIAS